MDFADQATAYCFITSDLLWLQAIVHGHVPQNVVVQVWRKAVDEAVVQTQPAHVVATQQLEAVRQWIHTCRHGQHETVKTHCDVIVASV